MLSFLAVPARQYPALSVCPVFKPSAPS